ncbi:Laccase 1 [Mycena indigotica]|uniref:Laccase 1 n=1 Tax=Mycena indigotica TaxID=2126181 RepID=A0A8H6RYF1_9AGAR|nr:Laccase 1 [Mycena indigotica]KAF7288968.1 Laccase 1 [Mycena indigotica]
MLTAATSLVALAFAAPALGAIGPVADLRIVNAQVAPDGFARSAVTAGGTIPGPIIKANVGDRLQLNVIDDLTDNTMLLSTSMHWHGFFQAGTAWADGPAFVTQCPIAQNDSFLYDFSTAGQPGTYWYHSHLSTQYCDGLRGVIVVYDPNDPNKSLYDVDDDSTVLTLADWYHAPVHTLPLPPTLVSTLINGLGRYAGGPTSQLAVVSVTRNKRHRFRLVSLSCDPLFTLSIDGHTMTIIEVDGVNHKACVATFMPMCTDRFSPQPLTVDSIRVLAGQRYSFVLNANQPVNNYWIRSVANGGTAGFANGINSAILRYVGAPIADPTTPLVASTNPLIETNLHPLVASRVPGRPVRGGADVNLNLAIGFTGAGFTVNGAEYVSPTAPVLLQIMSGAHTAAELLPPGSIYTLPPNSVVELSIPGGTVGGPHPMHLHGHTFWVVRSAGDSNYNYVDPVIRDVVDTGTSRNDNVTIRFETDNAGPWFLHCHIDFHLEVGLAVVFAEDTEKVGTVVPPSKWGTLCPKYNSLTREQLGGL